MPYDYDTFGTLIAETGTTPNAYLYCGEQFDADLGLYNNRARYLNIDSGGFWTRDPFEGITSEPASLHKFLYASADPGNRIDPSGYSDVNLNSQMFAVRIEGQLNKMSGPNTIRVGQKVYKRIGCGLVL